MAMHSRSVPSFIFCFVVVVVVYYDRRWCFVDRHESD